MPLSYQAEQLTLCCGVRLLQPVLRFMCKMPDQLRGCERLPLRQLCVHCQSAQRIMRDACRTSYLDKLPEFFVHLEARTRRTSFLLLLCGLLQDARDYSLPRHLWLCACIWHADLWLRHNLYTLQECSQFTAKSCAAQQKPCVSA